MSLAATRSLKARLMQLGTDAMHLEAVIQQFDPDYDLTSIKGIRQRGPDAAQRGDRSRVLLDVLRQAGEPLATAEIVRRVMALQGQDAGDKRAVRMFSKRVSLSLSRQERQGVLAALKEPGRPVFGSWWAKFIGFGASGKSCSGNFDRSNALHRQYTH